MILWILPSYHHCHSYMVPVARVEPARIVSPTDFESVTSAYSITPANFLDYYIIIIKKINIFFKKLKHKHCVTEAEKAIVIIYSMIVSVHNNISG